MVAILAQLVELNLVGASVSLSLLFSSSAMDEAMHVAEAQPRPMSTSYEARARPLEPSVGPSATSRAVGVGACTELRRTSRHTTRTAGEAPLR